MKLKIDTSKGWTQAIIEDDCEFSKFHNASSILQNILNVDFTDKVNDYDSYYWDFKFNGSVLCLHYNVFFGLSIYTSEPKNETNLDRENVIRISNSLVRLLED